MYRTLLPLKFYTLLDFVHQPKSSQSGHCSCKRLVTPLVLLKLSLWSDRRKFTTCFLSWFVYDDSS